MASIKVHLNAYRPNKEGAYPLYFQIIYCRKKRTFYSPYRLPLGNFNEKSGQVVNLQHHKIPHQQEINSYIRRTRTELLECIEFLQGTGRCFTAGDIFVRYKEMHTQSFILSYMEGLIHEQEREGRIGTAHAYRSTLNKLISFMGDNRNFTFSEVTISKINRFYSFLQNSGITTNTIRFYIRILRTVYNRAAREGIPGTSLFSPFRGITTSQTETIKRAIDQRLIGTISLVYLADHPKLDIARDFFFFSFYCRGMSFVDMAYLKKSNIVGDTLYYTRSKTGKPLRIKVIPPLWKLIRKYCTQGEYILPILHPAKRSLYTQYRSALKLHNTRLRRLSVLLDLPVPLTSYVARHSWATLARKNGVSVSVISESLGHSSEKITYTYLAALDPEVIDAANERVACSFVLE